MGFNLEVALDNVDLIQLHGHYQICTQSHVSPLESSHFAKEITRSGHSFKNVDEFHDIPYLM